LRTIDRFCPGPARAVRLAWMQCLGAGLLILLSACGSGTESVATLLERAAAHEQAGEYRAAAIELKTALTEDPDHAEARRRLGLVYLELGDGASAEKELARARELGVASAELTVPLERARFLQGQYEAIVEPLVAERTFGQAPPPTASPEGEAELSAIRGRAQIRLGRLAVADSLLDDALAIDPALDSALLGKAELAVRQQRSDEAREWLDRALADGDYPPAWLILGAIEQEAGRLEEAEAAYTRAAEGAPNPGSALLRRAFLRIETNNPEGARADLDTLVNRQIEHPGIPFARGLIEYREKRYGEAQQHFEAALKVEPDYSEARYYLGMVQAHQGRLEQAEAHLARYVADRPHDGAAVKVLANLRIERGDYAGAQQVLDRYLEHEGEDVDALELRGQVAVSSGRPDEGAGYLRRVAAARGDSGRAHERLGTSLLMAGQREEALEALSKALELDPSLDRAGLLRIQALLANGEVGRALQGARALREQHPDVAAYANLAGAIHLQLEEEQAAVAAFRHALELTPGYPPAGLNLARIRLQEGDVAGAREIYDSVLENFPSNLTARLARANLDISQGLTNEARVELETAIEHHPDAVLARILYSRLMMALGEPARALEATEAVRASNPDVPDLLQEIGNAQLALGQAEQAVGTFQRLVRVRPDAAAAHFLLARALAYTGDESGVRSSLQQALERDPEYLPARLAMLRLLVREKSWDELASRLAPLQESHPEEPEVLAATGALHIARGEHDEAARAYGAALEKRPTGPWTRELARAQLLDGNAMEARNTLEEWLAANPQDSASQLGLANLYAALGETQKARAAYRRVIELEPENVYALNALGWLFRDENPTLARTYAEHAHELAPDYGPAQGTLGTILLAQGETERAVPLLREAAAGGGHPAIRYNLARALAEIGARAEALGVLESLLAENDAFAELEAAQKLRAELAKAD